jgi:hypothetical protein
MTPTPGRSRPVARQRRINALVSVAFPPSAPTIISTIWRSIQGVLPRSFVRGALQARGVTGGGEGVVFVTPRVPTGSRVVSVGQPEYPTYFCRIRQAGTVPRRQRAGRHARELECAQRRRIIALESSLLCCVSKGRARVPPWARAGARFKIISCQLTSDDCQCTSVIPSVGS